MTSAALPRAPQGQAAQMMQAMAAPQRQTCAVRLVDRRTGLTHRINGSPLLVFTKAPEAAAAELLAGRDPAVWEARIETVEPHAQGARGRT